MKTTTYFLLIFAFFVTPLFQAQASNTNSSTKRSLENAGQDQLPKKRQRTTKNSQPTNTRYQNHHHDHNHNANSPDYDNINPLTQKESKQIYSFLAARFPNSVKKANEPSGQSNIDVNIQDVHGRTPLMIAIELGDENIASLILRHPSIDVNLYDDNQDDIDESMKTALMYAIEHGNDNIVNQILQDDKTDVNQEDVKGWTALMYAMKYSNKNIQTQILQHPSMDENQADLEDKTALHYAEKKGDKQIIGKIKTASPPPIKINQKKQKSSSHSKPQKVKERGNTSDAAPHIIENKQANEVLKSLAREYLERGEELKTYESGSKQYQYKCSACKTILRISNPTNSSGLAHVVGCKAIKETRSNPYKCDICKKHFLTRTLTNIHVRNVHLNKNELKLDLLDSNKNYSQEKTYYASASSTKTKSKKSRKKSKRKVVTKQKTKSDHIASDLHNESVSTDLYSRKSLRLALKQSKQTHTKKLITSNTNYESEEDIDINHHNSSNNSNSNSNSNSSHQQNEATNQNELKIWKSLNDTGSHGDLFTASYGNRLLVLCENSKKLASIDIDAGTKEEHNLEHNTHYPTSIAIDPSDEKIAIGYQKGDITVYHKGLDSKNEDLQTLNNNQNDQADITHLAFGTTNDYLFSVDVIGRVNLYKTNEKGGAFASNPTLLCTVAINTVLGLANPIKEVMVNKENQLCFIQQYQDTGVKYVDEQEKKWGFLMNTCQIDEAATDNDALDPNNEDLYKYGTKSMTISGNKNKLITSFSPNDDYHEISIWDENYAKEDVCLNSTNCHQEPIYALSSTRCGTFVASVSEHKVLIWEPARSKDRPMQELEVFSDASKKISSTMGITASGLFLVVTCGNTGFIYK